MGASSRRKGMRVEYKVRDCFRARGLSCCRVPLSGAQAGFRDDLLVCPHRGLHDPAACPSPVRVEVKGRGRMPEYLYQWGGGADVLVLVGDRKEPLVVLKFETYCELLVTEKQLLPT